MADEKPPRTDFVVMLTTACGCHRTIIMKAPLPADYRIPLAKPATTWLDGSYEAYATKDGPPHRKFVLRSVSEENGVAEYVEQL